MHDAIDAGKLRLVLNKALELTSQLERSIALQYFVDAARELTFARHAALGVLSLHGETIEFYHSGMTPEQAREMEKSATRETLFAQIPLDEVLIINDISALSEPHTALANSTLVQNNFLGVHITLQQQIWGQLYLANKPTDFTQNDAECMELLSKAATIALQNSRIYANSEKRSRWLRASQSIVASLLEGSDEEEALQVITDQMREAARADIALMILPSLNKWICEITAGEGSQKLIGVEFPRAGRAQTVIREQAGVVIDSMQRISTVRVPELREFGPALYAPLVSHGVGRGVIVLFRYPGDSEFDLHDLSMAESVAKQAAIALELAEARQAQEMAAELDERSRISRDLHDLAIQQLFASGMHITAVKEDLADDIPEAVRKALDNAIWAIDESVGQIRKIVQSLRDNSSPAAIVERLQHESSVALQLLGFAPSLLIRWNDSAIDDSFDITIIDDAIGSDISDDVVAVVREGLSNAARHAHASSVAVEVSVSLDQIEVFVTDDGAGITPSISRRSGLSNLAARARRHHGVFHMRPREDGHSGTELYWKAPLR